MGLGVSGQTNCDGLMELATHVTSGPKMLYAPLAASR